jgi:lipoprotein-releasing system permease protein
MCAAAPAGLKYFLAVQHCRLAWTPHAFSPIKPAVYKLFLTLRYLRKRRIAYFAIVAVTLCTAMVLIVMSVMGGFLDQLKVKARGLLGDIIIDNKSYSGFPLYDEFIADIAKWPEIRKATPVIYSFGLLRFREQTNTVRVVGIKLEDVYAVNAFKDSLYYERYYPGTTTLADQQQPLVGFDQNQQLIELRDPDGTRRQIPRPVLPAPYQQALEQSWAAGVRDTESPPTDLQDVLREGGLPEAVGVYGRVDDWSRPRLDGEPYPGLIIGRDIVAYRLSSGEYQRIPPGYERGRVVTVTLLPTSETGTIDTPVKQPFRYADDSRTGIYEIDSQHVYCDFALLQKLLKMDAAPRSDPISGETVGVIPGRCSQIQIKLAPGVDAAALTARLRDHYHALVSDPRYAAQIGAKDAQLVYYVNALTWEESQAHIIQPVEKERQLVTILFGIISLVAGFLVLCILYMIVLQKTRDIGIVKAVGGSPIGLALIFVFYGAFIGLVGGSCGAVFGCYFVQHINDVQDFLTRINPTWQVWNREVYSFDSIPNTVRLADVLTVALAAVAASTIGAVLAALRAGFQQPVEALRYE